MRIDLTSIGNSQGICIPQAILAQCGITDAVELEVRKGSMLLKPFSPRNDWDKRFEEAKKKETKSLKKKT